LAKKVLIVGAGSVQVAGIKRAQEMKLTVIATDANPEAPGLQIADIPVVLDVKDVHGTIALAKEHCVDGVLCIAVEAGVRTVSAVAQALDLPGPSVEAAHNATSKQRMREVWARAGVPSCQFAVCRTSAEAYEAADELGFPLVVKPTDNAGSRGVIRVDRSDDLECAALRAEAYSRERAFIVEEFMVGDEMSVEGIVYHGTLHVTGLSDKVRTSPPYLLDVAVMFPSIQALNIQKAAIGVVEDAIRSLDVDMATVHAEVMITQTGPKMVELAARGPGFRVFSVMIPWTGGIDVLRESIRIAIGECPELAKTANRGAVLIFPGAQPGRVVAISGVHSARAVPYVHDVDVYVKQGMTIVPLESGSNRIGHIVALADTRAQAETAARHAENLLQIDVQPE